ncbi:conserved phage C-terminal domain-containing protein [bacterium 210820-DFI.6.37]|nr:conserved phage C-terminal domain-containing protein [bacterium 210820-DFI.6.37]
MAKDPAFLFYTQDFLVGTMDMSDEEVGKYMRLLCRQHIKGNIHPKFMSDLSEEILSKFVKDNQGNYYNKRLKREIDRRNKYSESRRSNRSGVSQNEKHMKKTSSAYGNTHDSSYAPHMENENIYENENENINKKNKVGEMTTAVVERLNLICGTRYKATSKKTRSLIEARMNEGFSYEDFETVIEKKAAEWSGTEYAKYLRPETLFGTKFEGYLNQKSPESKSIGFMDL